MMAKSSDYQRGYGKGYVAGQRRGDAHAERYREEMAQAVHRAERAEAAQGFGKCVDCAHWSRGDSRHKPEQRAPCRWGECTPPRSQYVGNGADGSPLWFGNNGSVQQPILTSESFGCVLFRKKSA